MPGLISVLVELSQNLKRNNELNEHLIQILEGDSVQRCNNLFEDESLDDNELLDTLYYDSTRIITPKPNREESSAQVPERVQTLEETQRIYEQMKLKEMERENALHQTQLKREERLPVITEENTYDIISQLENAESNIDKKSQEVNEESENDLLMLRRAAYHKSQGTFQPTEESKKRTLKAKLELLGKEESNKLAFGILKEAKHNVQRLLCVDPASPDFDKRVEEEADRLLEVWGEMN